MRTWLTIVGVFSIATITSCSGEHLSLRPPFLAASTDVIEFGELAVGSEDERTLFLINSGEKVLQLQQPTGETLGGVFSVVLTETVVEPGRDVVARVHFAPLDTVAYETTFTFPNDSNNQAGFTATFRGTGVSSDPCYGVACQTPPSPCFLGQGECVQGTCIYPPNDGVGCTDDNLCTLDDSCSFGTCSGNTKRCEAAPPDYCFDVDTLRRYEAIGTCLPSTGDCEYDFQDLPCSFGCLSAQCEGDPCAGGCDDGNPCSVDSCNFGVGCEHVANDGAGCTAPSGACPVGVCVGQSCMSQSGELCTKNIDVDLCGDIDMAGVCTATGSCEVDEPPPEYQCSDCLGICLTCTILPGVQFEYKWCW